MELSIFSILKRIEKKAIEKASKVVESTIETINEVDTYLTDDSSIHSKMSGWITDKATKIGLFKKADARLKNEASINKIAKESMWQQYKQQLQYLKSVSDNTVQREKELMDKFQSITGYNMDFLRNG